MTARFLPCKNIDRYSVVFVNRNHSSACRLQCSKNRTNIRQFLVTNYKKSRYVSLYKLILGHAQGVGLWRQIMFTELNGLCYNPLTTVKVGK